MTIIIPMIILALVIGLSSKKTTPKLWAALCFGIIIVIVYAYVHPPQTTAGNTSTSGNASSGGDGATTGSTQ